MQISKNVHIVASGDAGYSLTHASDCTVYLVDCGNEIALVDTGCGLDTDAILREVRYSGFEPEQINTILITHGHGDHAGGLKALCDTCHAKAYAMEPAAEFIRQGDMSALSIESAIRAGIYPEGYSIEPCPVTSLADEQTIRIGNLDFTAHLAEGHSAGHACYTVISEGKTLAFVGDVISNGGKIALQAIWDCDLQQYIATLRKLSTVHIDGLFPGHGCFSLSRGWKQVEQALGRVSELKLPLNSIE